MSVCRGGRSAKGGTGLLFRGQSAPTLARPAPTGTSFLRGGSAVCWGFFLEKKREEKLLLQRTFFFVVVVVAARILQRSTAVICRHGEIMTCDGIWRGRETPQKKTVSLSVYKSSV